MIKLFRTRAEILRMELLWCDEAVLQLIEEVKKAEFVWNSRNPYFKNRYNKKMFWLQLVQKLNKRFPSIEPYTYDEILKKWNYLKTYYFSNCRRQKHFQAQIIEAGVQGIERFKVSWKFQSKLDFLSCMKPLPTVNNFNKQSLQNLQSAVQAFKFEYLEEGCPPNTEVSSRLNFFDEPPLIDPLHSSSTDSSRPETPKEWSRFQALRKSISTLEKPKEILHLPSMYGQSLSRTATSSESSPESQGLYQDSSNLEKCKGILRISATDLSHFSTSLSSETSFSAPSQRLDLKRKARHVKLSANETNAAKLKRASANLTQSLYYSSCKSKKISDNSSFGVLIASELDRLDPDLQIFGKKQMFTFLMQLQEHNLNRDQTKNE